MVNVVAAAHAVWLLSRLVDSAATASSSSQTVAITLSVLDGDEPPLLIQWKPDVHDLETIARNAARRFRHLTGDWPISEDGSPCRHVHCAAHLIATSLARQAGDVELANRRQKSHLRFRTLQPRSHHRNEDTVLAINGGHDASISVAIGGRVQCTLELERLFNERYYESKVGNSTRYEEHWRHALQAVASFCECDVGECPTSFDVAAVLQPLTVHRFFDEPHSLPGLVQQFFTIEQWQQVDHHEAHATAGFYASPFRSALIVSMDGGGPGASEATVAYTGNLFSTKHIQLLARLDLNLGEAYNTMSYFLPELHGDSIDFACDLLANGSFDGTWPFENVPDSDRAGKLMGYSALGEVQPELAELVKDWFMTFSYDMSKDSIDPKMLEVACTGAIGQRNLAASTQAVFQDTVLEMIRMLLPMAGGKKFLDGIVFVGGCALNVLTNQAVEDAFALPVFVPPQPNDGGLVVGASWAQQPPPAVAPLQYTGFRLWDLDVLEKEARSRSAIKISGPYEVAAVLAGLQINGRRPIMGLMRGRQEFGPRALGHRSLLAVPDAEDIKERLNDIKSRKWYRPVAPMIAEESLPTVFGRTILSPYMTKAAKVQPDILKRFPGLAHVDGTARHQSVSTADEPWIHALLSAVGKGTGLAALINTSFNTKGKPIVNTVQESLAMLDNLAGLDFVLIEDWLFTKGSNVQEAHEFMTAFRKDFDKL